MPKIMTTAYRSVLEMRKQGFTAECVEHRRGHIRFDFVGIADVLAYKEGSGIILIQAYHKSAEKNHAHLLGDNKKIREWINSGGIFEHHLWGFRTKKGRKFWSVERRVIK